MLLRRPPLFESTICVSFFGSHQEGQGKGNVGMVLLIQGIKSYSGGNRTPRFAHPRRRDDLLFIRLPLGHDLFPPHDPADHNTKSRLLKHAPRQRCEVKINFRPTASQISRSPDPEQQKRESARSELAAVVAVAAVE